MGEGFVPQRNYIGDNIQQRPIFCRHKDNIPLVDMGSLNLSRTFKDALIFYETMRTSLNFVHGMGLQSCKVSLLSLERMGGQSTCRRYFGDFMKLLKGAFEFTYVDAMKMLMANYILLEKKSEVSRQTVGNKFSCTYMRMESFGLPYVHILVVLVRLEYPIIPNTLSKTAKLHYDLNCTRNETQEQKITYRSRLGAFA
ncbi:hypothetical protein Ahy_A07g036767 [Arachis hypogaea]|uniref:Uncharacterized protein n=1 Tax=Arachis hypogaea TaxID=3818 RepID=A0A445CGY3_ARAHY|nr:hypothetical protein Ahy_A07g036767 [Arachis hypogaea]